MSYTTLYKVPAKGKIESFQEFGNSRRGAAMLWAHLGRKYIPGFRDMHYDSDSARVRKLAKDPRLHDHEKDVLLSTLDGAMLAREHFERVAAAMDRVAKELTRVDNDKSRGLREVYIQDPGHYPEHAAALRRMLDDQAAYAACWDQTSVASDQWTRYDECETCGHELDDTGRMYDISRDSGHWFMLEEE